MRTRTTPIPPPVVGLVVPSRERSALTATDRAKAIDWSRLDTPTVLRRAPREWADLSAEDRAACRAVAIARLREMHGPDAEPAVEIVERCWR